MFKEISKFIPSVRNFLKPNIYNKNRTLHLSTVANNVEPFNNSNSINSSNELDKLFSRVEIEIKGSDPAVLKSYSWFATNAAENLGIEVGRNWALRKSQKDRLTLLKSVHIYKKHRVQYEIRTYFRFMHFHKLTGSTLDTFLEYIERNIPEGVALKATKVEIEALAEHLKSPPSHV